MNNPLDLATVNIVTSALHGITEEMGLNLLRSARSTIIREARDYACALMDASGRLIAQAEHTPIQTASIALPLEACLKRHPRETISSGEVLIMNDPYQGGQHLQDIIILLPVFHAGSLVAFSGSVAHHIDIGGGAPGLTLDAADIYAEGLRFTALKLREEDFAEGGLMTAIVDSNFREPVTSMGDLRAQLAACRVGRQRVGELYDKYSAAVVDACIEAALDRSETLMRAALKQLPNGTYLSADCIDSGVFDQEPIRVKLALTIEEGSVHLDFTGTDPQTRDFLNVPYASTVAAAYSAIAMVAVAGGRRIPANAGGYRPITFDVPAGSLLNPRPPAPVRARMCGAYRVFDAVLLALQQAAPQRMPALGFNVNTTVGFWRKSADGFRIFIEDIGGGWGGTPVGDGPDMLDAPLSNCKITPVEVLELDHPYLRVSRYEYIPDSGGDGQFRGGLGSVREFEILDEDVTFFAYSDRHAFPPTGSNGGRPGLPGKFVLVHGSQTSTLASKTASAVPTGSRIRVIAGGGGGFGSPASRSPEARAIDRTSGKVISGSATEEGSTAP
jgi:N-methylhydantoinase B